MSTIADHNVEIGADISDFERAMNDMQDQMEKVGDQMSGVGETLSKGLTLPLAAIGAAGVMMATDTDNALGKIQAGLGVTADQAEKLRDSAEDLWKNGFGDSVTDVSDSLIKVKQNLGAMASESDLKEITGQAYVLANAFGADISDSSKTAATMMKNFGISGQEAMDLMTVGFQKGGDYSGELLDTLNEYAPSFSNMGINAEDALGILLAGAEAGAFNLDKVGDAMKEFNIRAKDGSKTTADGFKAIGLNASQMGEAIAKGGTDGEKAFQATVTALAAMKDPVKQTAAGVALFGTQWEDLEANVITSMGSGIGSIKEVDGAAKKAGDALNDNLGSRLTSVWRQFLDGVEPVGVVLVSFAEKVLPPLSAALSTVANWFGSLSGGMQTAIVVVGLILAAIGPLLIIFGSLATSITSLMPVFTAIGGMFTAISVPIWPLIAAIAALIAIGVLLYKNWDEVKKYALEAWDAIYKNAIKPAIDAIVRFITAQMDKIKQFWNQNGQQILQAAQNVWGFIVGYIKMVMGVLQGVFQAVWPIISGAVQIAWGLIKNIISTGIDVILGIIKTFAAVFTGDWKGAFNAVLGIAKDILNGVTGVFRGINLLQIGKDIINGLVRGIGSMAGAVSDAIKNIADKVTSGVKKALSIHSPSKVMMELGGYTTEGFAAGILSQVRSVNNAANLLSSSAVSGIDANSSFSAVGSGQPIIITMSGREVARGVMPYAVNDIRQKTGIKFN